MNQTDDRKTCSLCNRKFNSDRLDKHIEVCKKQKEKKRNVFDSSKQRQIVDANEENNETKKVSTNKTKAKIVKPVKRPAVKVNNTGQATNNRKNVDESYDKATNGTTNSTNESIESQPHLNGTTNGTNDKSEWREKHDEFVKSIQSARRLNGTTESDEQTHNKNESIDRESTITTNSDSTNSATNTTTSTTSSTITRNQNATNERGDESTGESKSKQSQRKLKPPQATRLNKMGKLSHTENGQQSAKLNNGQVMKGNSNAHNGTSNHHPNAINKKSINANIECAICGRTFNRAAGERHIAFCAEKERQRKNSSNATNNEEALARFRLRNAYRSNKGIRKRDKSVPNEKKEDKYVRQSSLRRALSTIDGLDQVFTKGQATNQLHSTSITNLASKRSTSQGNLNRNTTRYANRNPPVRKLPITTQSKSSSASSKASHHNHSSSVGYREQAQSRVKARLNQQQKLQKQRMNSNYPKTPVMKFKEKFPNHNNKLIEFADSQQFSQMFKKHLDNSFERNNLPKTVPGVRTGGQISPTKEIRNGQRIEDMNDLEQLRARIKEMYLSTNGSHSQNDFINSYHLANNEFANENSFTRENSSSKLKSKSVNDFQAINDGLNDDNELPKTCHTCSTDYITMSARYCFNCGMFYILVHLHNF